MPVEIRVFQQWHWDGLAGCLRFPDGKDPLIADDPRGTFYYFYVADAIGITRHDSSAEEEVTVVDRSFKTQDEARKALELYLNILTL